MEQINQVSEVFFDFEDICKKGLADYLFAEEGKFFIILDDASWHVGHLFAIPEKNRLVAIPCPGIENVKKSIATYNFAFWSESEKNYIAGKESLFPSGQAIGNFKAVVELFVQTKTASLIVNVMVSNIEQKLGLDMLFEDLSLQ